MSSLCPFSLATLLSLSLSLSRSPSKQMLMQHITFTLYWYILLRIIPSEFWMDDLLILHGLFDNNVVYFHCIAHVNVHSTLFINPVSSKF